MKKKEAKVVSYIHVGEGGKDDLEKYIAGKSSLTLQVTTLTKKKRNGIYADCFEIYPRFLEV